ncbi:YCF48-related protein [Marinoscillum sp. MHG1-6]|uniref:YCF48-related protein n=1 Tax=Marinoscillum sp. MHG1-6 TaxID=2959627 RepID=UPI0021588341|nr:YCF48-related protein [Marinoscillum sp. MHG1-6]
MHTVQFFLVTVLLSITMQVYGQWTIQNYDAYSRFNKIKFRTETEGFLLGDYSQILKTTDGGATWNSIYAGTSVFFQDFQLINDSTLIASGFYYENAGDNKQSKVLKSMDNGDTWQVISTLPNKKFYSQWFFDDEVGLLSGFDGIYKTSDSGTSWDLVAEINSGKDNKLFFVDDSTGFAANGTILLKSDDQGQTWTSYQEFENEIHSIHFFNQNKGVIGSVGKVYQTSDGGNSWKEDSIVSNLSVLSIDFISDSTGYMVSTYTGPVPLYMGFVVYTAISRTTDGGDHWESVMIPGELYSIDFISESNGYISGGGNLIMNYKGGAIDELPADYPWKISGITEQKPPIKSVFPNPVRDQLTIEFATSIDLPNIALYSIDGRLIKAEQTMMGNFVEIDLSQHPKGVYLLKVIKAKEQQTFKIIK